MNICPYSPLGIDIEYGPLGVNIEWLWRPENICGIMTKCWASLSRTTSYSLQTREKSPPRVFHSDFSLVCPYVNIYEYLLIRFADLCILSQFFTWNTPKFPTLWWNMSYMTTLKINGWGFELIITCHILTALAWIFARSPLDRRVQPYLVRCNVNSTRYVWCTMKTVRCYD